MYSSADLVHGQLRMCLSAVWLSCLPPPEAGVHTSSVRSLRYGWWAYALGERTTPRLGPNSKIITVDGNLASGKGAVAQKLADKLGNYPPFWHSEPSLGCVVTRPKKTNKKTNNKLTRG